MKRLLTFCLILLSSIFLVQAQPKTPDDFLGYELGTHFTPHHKVADYFRQIAAASPKNVKLIEYGKTNEGRPLMVAIVSAPENIIRI